MYIGQEPATSFTGLIKQDFTVSATTSYTLSHSVNNANDIALYRNFVRQEPTTAYSCTGTSLTLTSATVSGDDLYCIYLGQALQTVNPANASVGNTQVASSIINGQTAETSIADADEVLIYDSSASALRKMTKANFVTGIGGANTPSFYAKMSSHQGVSHNANVKVQFDTEVYDTDGCYDHSTNYRFTPTTAGKYLVTVNLYLDSEGQSNMRIFSPVIYKNGSNYAQAGDDKAQGYENNGTESLTAIVDMNGSSDYLEVYVYHYTQDNTSSNVGGSGTQNAMFTAHKLIGV